MFVLPGINGKDTVLQNPSQVTVQEGQDIVLSCSYSTAGSTLFCFEAASVSSDTIPCNNYPEMYIHNLTAPNPLLTIVHRNKVTGSLQSPPVNVQNRGHSLRIKASFSQSVVQTPPAVTRQECQSLSITCVFYGGFFARPLTRGDFFRQTQTGTERERISSDERFVMRTNEAEKTFWLEIRDVRVEDSVTYYCKAQYKVVAYYDTVDGSGTVVTVTAASSSTVSQSPLLQTSTVGDTITLSCEYSGACQYTVHWYCQSPGQPPKYLLQRHTSGEGNEENTAGGRISATIDPAEKISRLNIAKLQLSDSAVYYCAPSRRTAQCYTARREPYKILIMVGIADTQSYRT
uniref:uncharacterized protein n=1 Tax=Pristiophorus japonicus TaxID=55135 RepID=UPI00398F677F